MVKLNEPVDIKTFPCFKMETKGDCRMSQGGTKLYLFPPARITITPNCPLRVRARFYDRNKTMLKDNEVIVKNAARTFTINDSDGVMLLLDMEPDFALQSLNGLSFWNRKVLGALGSIGESTTTFDVYKYVLQYESTTKPTGSTGMKGLGQSASFFQSKGGTTPAIDTTKQGQTSNLGPPVKSGDTKYYTDQTYYVVWYVNKNNEKAWLYGNDKDAAITTAKGAQSRGIVTKFLTRNDLTEAEKLKISGAYKIVSEDKGGYYDTADTGKWKSDELCMPEVSTPPAIKVPKINWAIPDLSMLSKMPEFKDLFPNTSKLFIKNKDGTVSYYEPIKIFERTQKILTKGMPQVKVDITEFYKIIANTKLKMPIGPKKGTDFYPFTAGTGGLPLPNINDFKYMFDSMGKRITDNATASAKLLGVISSQYTTGKFKIISEKPEEATPDKLSYSQEQWDFTWDEIAHSPAGNYGGKGYDAIKAVVASADKINSLYVKAMAKGWEIGKYSEDVKRIQEISNAITSVSKKTVENFGNSLKDSMLGLRVIGNGAAAVLTQTTDDIGNLIKFMAELSSTVLLSIGDAISKKIKEIIDSLQQFLNELMSALNLDTADLRDAIVGMVSKMWNALTLDIQNIYKSLSETMGVASANLAKSLETNVNKIGPVVEDMLGDYTKWANDNMNTVNNCMKHNTSVLTNMFTAKIDEAEKLLKDNINKVKAEITATFDSFKLQITTLTEGFKTDIENAKKNVESLKASVDASIKQLDTRTESLKADLDTKYDSLTKSFESKQKEVLAQMTTIQNEVQKNADSVKKIYDELNSLKSKVADLESKITAEAGKKPSWAFW